ncbi:pre-mRNA-splicing factor CWC15 [Tritrichomonas foetus]|uniref:Pre-mRNA-splicing factor CWC15 n=1 Tax=Tritrichomonas foetus TaxID=1144522 RepID=A0A1J4JQF7_9EUKA|nr:pre-mRNA-splicing factor CWC15 [Tritrichomonas foetus]|eukprot:OHT00648.1 pre-mRNA-splicing factor CWC15 [Tritrichomonas foetus]
MQKLDGPKINFDDDNNADGKYSNIHDFDDDDEDDSDSSSIDTDTGDEDDEQAALLNELERMKREKAEEEERKIREAQDQIRNQFTANPLLDPDYSTKRQWTEEAIFHNQALITHQKKADRYVNDPIRSEYHQKFMQKYLRM